MPSVHPPTMSGAALRNVFIQYFADTLGHKHLPSASLIPSNPTVLLTPAGMLPFVPIFLGVEQPPTPPRVVTVQKCARVSGKASDLSYVGRTPRHHTFFEMLGNFSFGDYFKAEIIPWAWTFITEHLKLSPDRLWVSVFTTDFESRDIWRDVVGVPEHRIVFRDEKDNFWGPPGPSGPCGPCSEIYYFFGETLPTEADPLDHDEMVEFWNLVFMEFFQDVDGKQTPLERKNVDTGLGLERLAMILQGKTNTFETDLFFPIVEEASKLTGTRYNTTKEIDTALKIVADHSRFVAFALADGIRPSNEGRGYVLRMILRRAVMYGKQALGVKGPFIYQIIAIIRDRYQNTYPELKTHYSAVVDVVKQEEKRFFHTLERGQRMLEETLDTLRQQGQTVIAGDAAFKLYDTFGFPLELTADLALSQGFTVNEAAYELAMTEQRELARSSQKGKAIVQDDVFARLFTLTGPTHFLGYDTLTATATVKALLVDGQPVDKVSGTNQAFEAILDATPFYAESGGQVGDRGSFSREDGHHGLTVVVNDTVKVGELFVHRCLFDNGGALRVSESLVAQVDPTSRSLSAMHHSGTHLLQAALQKVLGPEVHQAGSRVTPEGARFDFTFHRGVSPDELARIEFWMNQWIRENHPRSLNVTDMDSARQLGALMMADEKYGELVRVIGFGVRSTELCGGTHVDRLGDIGLVKIVSEGAIASGVRRIELVAGEAAYKAFKQADSMLNQLAAQVKVPVRELPDKLEKLQDQLKTLEKQKQALEEKLAAEQVKALRAQVDDHGVLVMQVSGTSAEMLRWITERLGDLLPSRVLLLATVDGDKVAFVCSVSDDWIVKGMKAGDLVKQAATICGGGGGGKPQFAQAGGKDPSKLAEALNAVKNALNK